MTPVRDSVFSIVVVVLLGISTASSSEPISGNGVASLGMPKAQFDSLGIAKTASYNCSGAEGVQCYEVDEDSSVGVLYLFTNGLLRSISRHENRGVLDLVNCRSEMDATAMKIAAKYGSFDAAPQEQVSHFYEHSVDKPVRIFLATKTAGGRKIELYMQYFPESNSCRMIVTYRFVEPSDNPY